MIAIAQMVFAFLGSGLGKIAAIGLGTLALWGAFKFHYEGKGADKVRAQVIAAGVKNANKANAARAKASRLPPDRLRDRYFRD